VWFDTGALCGQDIDECMSLINPCRNGATCQNKNGSFDCVCPAGYEGRLCDVNPNECQPGKIE